MKRILGLIIVGVVVLGAVALPEPPPVAGPDFVGPQERESVAAATASVWYCPWVASGALRDSTVMIATKVPLAAEITLPQQIADEDADLAMVSVVEPGAMVVPVGEIVRRGDTPLFIELSDGPASVAVVESSTELLTGDTCVARIPKVWELPGGTTREGRTLTLRLFNPFPELAKVSVSGASESGETGLIDLQNLDVAARTWQDVNLNSLVPLLDDLALTVTSSEGFVIPSLVVAGLTDEASWPGVAPSANWEFPVATVSAQYAPSLMLTNGGNAPVNAVVDVYTSEGATISAREVVVDPSVPRRVDLSDLADGAMGVRVRASAPLAAVVLAEESVAAQQPTDEEGLIDEDAILGDRIAGTIGVSVPATEWLLPGLQAVAEGSSSLWILNTGTESATITLQALGSSATAVSKQSVPPGTVLGVPLGFDEAIGGYQLESSVPVSVAWSAEATTGLMFVSGTVVGG
ncbi:MAG: hypothetical protein GY788_19820 [bacterium]|nr:hypothetical protein [bacterium]